MVRSTLIARVSDGLPLAASMDDDEGNELATCKHQAKSIVKRLSSGSESRCTVDSGGAMDLLMHYAIEQGVCYLCICDKSYPKKLAFAYLEELLKEFNQSFGAEVSSVARPYAFIKFDSFIQKTKRQYQDSRSQRNLTKLNDDLQDVTRIMTKNINEVLGRGERLDRMSEMSSNLSAESKKYSNMAKKLQWQAIYRQYGPPIIVILVVLLVLYLRSYF